MSDEAKTIRAYMFAQHGLWLVGIGLIVAGYPQWAWVPIAGANYFGGYSDGIKRKLHGAACV